MPLRPGTAKGSIPPTIFSPIFRRSDGHTSSSLASTFGPRTPALRVSFRPQPEPTPARRPERPRAAQGRPPPRQGAGGVGRVCEPRSEEHTSELQSLMGISYAVFCLKKNNKRKNHNNLATIYTIYYITITNDK